MSSIKSEVEVLRIFDCFDDGTARKRSGKKLFSFIEIVKAEMKLMSISPIK